MNILKLIILKQMANKIEFITLNLASFGWVISDVLFSNPNWITILIGVSIVFFNVVRGVAIINKIRNENKNKTNSEYY